MTTRQPTTTATLDDQPIPARAKLAAAWTSFMFLYAYVDILGFYTPGVVDEILDGRVFEFDLSQTFSTTVLTVLAIPIFMVVLSLTLPARPNRITNLVVASLYVPFTVFNVAGGFYLYFYGLGVVLGDPYRPHPAVRLDLAPHRTVRDQGDKLLSGRETVRAHTAIGSDDRGTR